jgi:hypothetical protein
MIPVNSIEIPERFVMVACDWNGGLDCMLYAVASTGGLTTGTIRPTDDEGRPVSDERWYCNLWWDLSADIAYARRACKRSIKACPDDDDVDYPAELAVLNDFEEWVDEVVLPGLEARDD